MHTRKPPSLLSLSRVEARPFSRPRKERRKGTKTNPIQDLLDSVSASFSATRGFCELGCILCSPPAHPLLLSPVPTPPLPAAHSRQTGAWVAATAGGHRRPPSFLPPPSTPLPTQHHQPPRCSFPNPPHSHKHTRILARFY